MQRITARLTYANVVSTVCLFILLGGGAYAATRLPRGSVGPAQIKRNAVTSSKVKNRSLRAVDFKRAQLPRGPQGPAGPPGERAFQLSGIFGPPDFARVALDGTLDQARTQGGAREAKRVSPGSGAYCLTVLISTYDNDVVTTPRNVTVTPESPDTAVAATVDHTLIPPDCGNVYITTTDASDGTPKDSAFYASFD
jgi:hypothetical protein